jgi:hypothetical protein
MVQASILYTVIFLTGLTLLMLHDRTLRSWITMRTAPIFIGAYVIGFSLLWAMSSLLRHT